MKTPWKRVWTGFVGGSISIFRASVPGGWLIMMHAQKGTTGSASITFCPDAKHEWDGTFADFEVVLGEKDTGPEN